MGIDLDKVSPRFRELIQAAEAGTLPPPLKAPGTPGPTPSGRKRSPKTPEIKIHDQIVAVCDRNGLVPVHPDPSRKSTIRTGYPDFFVCGRHMPTLAAEVKVPPNTLSKAQAYEFPKIEACGVRIVLCVETTEGEALRTFCQAIREHFKIENLL